MGLGQTAAASIGNFVRSTTLMMVCYGFAEAGLAFILSIIGAGVVVIIFALNVSELAVAMLKAGSMGEYARAACGPVCGLTLQFYAKNRVSSTNPW